jgi:glycyl-tRNA synthetase beta chain
MRWGAGSLRWVRPLHSILCLMTDEAGAEVVPLWTVDGIARATPRAATASWRPAVCRDGVRGLRGQAAPRPCDAGRRGARRAYPAEAESLAFAQGLELVEDAGCWPRSRGWSNGPWC